MDPTRLIQGELSENTCLHSVHQQKSFTSGASTWTTQSPLLYMYVLSTIHKL